MRELALSRGFSIPNWDEPLDAAGYLDAVPPEATVKGMFVEQILGEGRRQGIDLGRPKFPAFRDVPLVTLMEILLELGPRLWPDIGVRQSLRRMGHWAYPTLLQSLIGRVIFGVLGDDMPAIFRLTSKGYSVSLRGSEARVVEVGEHHAQIELERMYNFADSYQVGVFEGAMAHYGREYEVLTKRYSRQHVELFAIWGDAPGR